MGGVNTWTPIRPFKPVYVKSPLLSNDVAKIRKHYNLKCEKEGMEIGDLSWSKTLILIRFYQTIILIYNCR